VEMPMRSALLDKGRLALRSNLHQPDSRNDTYVFALPLICTQYSLLQRTDLGRILRAIHQTERTGTLWRQVCHP
jgi:branched-subunit amino acid ABC-type transport system permease component